jgi:hypothetical protein
MPAYYDGPDDIYYEPSESEINDWNIHNDHQGDNEDPVDEPVCIECGNLYVPHWDIHTCDSCMADYWHRHPDPLDIAEMEDLEDRSAGLEDPWWRRP